MNTDFYMFLIAYLVKYPNSHWSDIFYNYTATAPNADYHVPPDGLQTLLQLIREGIVAQDRQGYITLIVGYPLDEYAVSLDNSHTSE